jgi:AraC family transcriptional regulator
MNEDQNLFDQFIPVLDFIQENYTRTIPPKELEAISFYSYRNLQRIFKALFGETIGTHQKRIRLESAAKLMHYSNKSISDIAIEVGYADLQSFRKAFKKEYLVPPSDKRIELIELLNGLNQNKSISKLSIQSLDSTLVKLPFTAVLFKTHRGSYDNSKINRLWEELLDAKKDIEDNNHYGLVYDDPDITQEGFCRYDACIECTPHYCSNHGSVKKIGGHTYMRFTHFGDYDAIESTYTIIFGGWLLQNNLDLGASPIIEHYCDHSLNTNKKDIKTYIYIPLA